MAVVKGTLRTARLARLARRALDAILLTLVAIILIVLALGRLVPFLGGTTFVVVGPSMGEAAPIGSAVVATPVNPRDLAVGDIVSIQVGTQRAIFTHRIVRLVERGGEVWLETRGDANPEPDPAIVPASSVLGRANLVVPNAGYVLALLSTLSGLAFVCGLAAFLAVGAWLLETLEVEPDVRPAAPAPPRPPVLTAAGDAPPAGP